MSNSPRFSLSSINYLEAIRIRDWFDKFDNEKFFVIIPVYHVNRNSSWHLQDVSRFKIMTLSSFLSHQRYGCSPLIEEESY